jgi:hypothetical protein
MLQEDAGNVNKTRLESELISSLAVRCHLQDSLSVPGRQHGQRELTVSTCSGRSCRS